MSDDLDRRIADGLDSASSYVPRTAELLPVFRRRVTQRRRRTTAGVVVALMAFLGVGMLVVDRDDEPRRAVTAGSTTSTTAAPTVTSTGLNVGPALEPTDVRLPDEGIAVEVTDVGVVLVGTDGHVYGHLPGLGILDDEETAGPLLLVARTEDLEDGEDAFFVLGDGLVRPVRSTDHHVSLPLSYGAELDLSLGDPRAITLRRGTEGLFPTVSTMDTTVHVSHDRDVVSVDAFEAGTNRAYDLRSGKVHDVRPDCWVADRHGPRWYLLCRGGEGRAFVAAGDRTDSASAVLDRGQVLGHWRKAMVSPDGKQLLLQWSGECEVQEAFLAPSTGGRLDVAFPGMQRTVDAAVMAEAYGWTGDGRPVVYLHPQPGCGEGLPEGGVYTVDVERPTQPASIYPVPAAAAGQVGRVAMWAPTLR